ncbi:hypothetical protein AB0L53_23795 [Nonomuraea sp. NPDC052129]
MGNVGWRVIGGWGVTSALLQAIADMATTDAMTATAAAATIALPDVR